MTHTDTRCKYNTQYCQYCLCVFFFTNFTNFLWHNLISGISKHFHLGSLVDLMNNVYEDEDTDFEDVLDDDDLQTLESRKDVYENSRPLVFRPKYKIRPDADQACYFLLRKAGDSIKF